LSRPPTRTKEARYPIQAVAARTGLTPPLLRAWERRYGAVTPERGAGGERLYSDRQIHRLNLLRMLTQSGHRISRIAQLPTAELERLLLDVGISPFDSPVRAENSDLEHVLFGRGLAAVNALDLDMLDAELERARTVLPPLALIDSVLCPLIRRAEDIPAKGPVVRASRQGLIDLLTEVARSVARTVSPLGSGRSMLIWNLGTPRDPSLAMAAAAASLQGMRAEILHDEADGEDVADYVISEPSAGIVVSLPCEVGADEAEEVLRRLRERLGSEHVVFCVAPIPEVFARIESIRGFEVCSTFRDLAELIDTNRN
jgi:DNA-binding transcriptional MerR regulator